MLFTKPFKFIYIRNNTCVIYIHGNRNTKLFRAMNSHVEFCTDSSSDSVSISLPVIDAFAIPRGILYHGCLLHQ